MSNSKIKYKCTKCEKTLIASDDETPSCCGKNMVKDALPQCTTTEHPEMARNTDDNEPCDDGTGKA